MNSLRLIIARVEKLSETGLKIVWCYEEQTLGVYTINLNLIQDLANDIRDKLSELVESFLESTNLNAGTLMLSSNTSVDNKIENLAKAGFELYTQLFLDEDGSEQTTVKTTLQEFQEEGKYRISFVVNDETIYIPWGLIYDNDPENNTINKQNFWCIKYYLSNNLSRILRKQATEQYKLLSIVNEEIYSKVHKHLTQQELDVYKWLLQTSDEQKLSGRNLLNKLGGLKEKNLLLSFYCHANSSNLAISSDDEVSLHDLQKVTNKVKGCWILFLNGCLTATGSTKEGFLQILASNKFYGFIGTETAIPNVFAFRFGIQLLHKLFSTQSTLLEVMHQMRQQHWPLSLMYSVYCSPILTFSKNNIYNISSVPVLNGNNNFSNEVVGEQ